MYESRGLQKVLDLFVEGDKVIGPVYQYRGSYPTLINILKSRRLQMTDSTELNGEIQYSLSFLKEKVPDRTLKFPPANKNIEQSSFWNCFEFYQKQLRVFITSLCLNRDDRHLWEVYGNGGLGFAIGFSKEYINLAFSPNNNEVTYNESNGLPNVALKVHYEKNKLCEIANGILEDLSYMEKIQNPQAYWEILKDLYSKIIPRLPGFKEFGTEHKYELENEYRLYAMDLDPFKNKIPESQIKKIKGKSRIYSEQIPLQHITEIIVGSKNDFDKIECDIRKELKDFFSEQEVDNIKIIRSDVNFD